VSRPNVTAIVDGLVERQLVERLTDPDDRRRVRHALTAAGRAALAAADESVDERLLAIAEQLPPAKARRAVTGLGLWTDALDAARRARVAAR
jgi:DNA-binding MarR family transcriptional regulator